MLFRSSEPAAVPPLANSLPLSDWPIQVRDSDTTDLCTLAIFRLTFAAEYSMVKNSKDMLGTAKHGLPKTVSDVSGSCSKSRSHMVVNWEGSSYTLTINFVQVKLTFEDEPLFSDILIGFCLKKSPDWWIDQISFKYDLEDSSVFPYAAPFGGE